MHGEKIKNDIITANCTESENLDKNQKIDIIDKKIRELKAFPNRVLSILGAMCFISLFTIRMSNVIPGWVYILSLVILLFILLKEIKDIIDSNKTISDLEKKKQELQDTL